MFLCPLALAATFSLQNLLHESLIKVKSSHHNSPSCLFLLVPVQARRRGPRQQLQAPRQGGIQKPSHVKFHKSLQFFTTSWQVFLYASHLPPHEFKVFKSLVERSHSVLFSLCLV
jgi:hypothetical protein